MNLNLRRSHRRSATQPSAKPLREEFYAPENLAADATLRGVEELCERLRLRLAGVHILDRRRAPTAPAPTEMPESVSVPPPTDAEPGSAAAIESEGG